MRTTLFTAVVGLCGIVVSATATTRGKSSRRLRLHSDDSQRFLKKDKKDDDSCLDFNQIFRVCNNRRRNLVRSRLLKMDKGEDPPPVADSGYNIEIGEFELTLGASLLGESGDCDCREEVEEAVLEYLDETFSNNDYEILCVALVDVAGQGSNTLGTFTITFQVRNMFEADFEAQSTCSAEDLVLCCMAAEIGTAMNPQRDCADCDLTFCATPNSGQTLTDILNDEVDECGNVDFEEVAPATASPMTVETFSPTLAPSVESDPPTLGPSMTPLSANVTSTPTAPPTFGPTMPRLPADTTRAPTDPPTFGPTMSRLPPDTTRAPTDPPTFGPTMSRLPPDTTRAPTDPPTFGPTMTGLPADTTRAPTDSPTPGLPLQTTRAPTGSPVAVGTDFPTMLPTFPITMEPSDMGMGLGDLSVSLGDLSVSFGDLSVPFGDLSVPFGDLSVFFANSLPN